jgi:hypothetical protein
MKVLAVLLRRVAVAAGFLFGFGLLALVMASQAGAETSEASATDSARGGLTPVTGAVQDVLGGGTAEPTADEVRNVSTAAVEPLTGAVHDALAPVGRTVKPLTNAVHDVVAPVRTALAPVTDTVGVVTRSLAPVLEAVLSPVVNAVAPVPEPDSGSGGAGRPGWQVGATVDASPAGGHSGGCSGSGYLGNRSGVDGHGDRTGHRARCARGSDTRNGWRDPAWQGAECAGRTSERRPERRQWFSRWVRWRFARCGRGSVSRAQLTGG